MVERPPVERLLLVYYILSPDGPVQSPLGKDPSASRIPGGAPLPRLIAMRCDVAACLATLTDAERQAIERYWSLFFSREEHDGNAARARAAAMQALREGNRSEVSRLQALAKAEQDQAGRLNQVLTRHRRSTGYIKAMERLEVEVAARDLYARAIFGDTAGFTGCRPGR